jgi:hypothetical protein
MALVASATWIAERIYDSYYRGERTTLIGWVWSYIEGATIIAYCSKTS